MFHPHGLQGRATAPVSLAEGRELGLVLRSGLLRATLTGPSQPQEPSP